MTIYSWTSQRP